MAVVDPRYVYEDLLTMPDDGKRYELLDGDLLVSPSPNRRHQAVVRNLVRLLGRLQDEGLGEVYPAPFDVVFDRHTVVEPDVIFVRAERLGIVTDRNVSGPPDLVVEVLSDSTREADLGRKLRAYGRHGVGEYWVVDPDADTIRVFRREGEAFVEVGTVERGGEIAFLGATLKVDEILA
jgi:Uma2 family endonuclease